MGYKLKKKSRGGSSPPPPFCRAGFRRKLIRRGKKAISKEGGGNDRNAQCTPELLTCNENFKKIMIFREKKVGNCTVEPSYIYIRNEKMYNKCSSEKL